MSYSLYHSNPFIDLCTHSINVHRTSQVWFITTPTYLNESDLLIAVKCTFKETSLTSLSFRKLPKIPKLHLEIFSVNRLLENQLETVAKSEFNLLSRSNRSVDE